jgi:TRAP-type C4-dicarboxylate transport system permease small subunit
MNLIERTTTACSLLLYRLACGVVLPVLALLLVADIAFRTLQNATLHWASEMSGFLLIVLFFLALPHQANQRGLLHIELLNLPITLKSHPVFGRLLALLPPIALLLFSLLLTTQSVQGLRDMLRYGDQAFSLPLPLWPLYALMLMSSTLMLLIATLHLIRATRPETSA